MRRTVSIVVAGLLAIVVGATIVKATRPASKRVVHGDVASALQPFFQDPAVQRELAHKGFRVVADDGRDFTFTNAPNAGTTTVFSTPLVAVASSDDAARLAALGVAHNNGRAWTLDPAQLMRAITAGTVAVHTDGPTSPAGSYLAALLASTMRGADTTTQVNAIRPAFAPQPTGVPSLTIAFAADAHPNGSVVMQPKPDVVASAAITPHSKLGTDFAHTLETDAALQRLAPTPAALTPLTQFLDTAVHVQA